MNKLNNENLCSKCGISATKGVVLKNTPDNKLFRYMEDNQKMHIECYLKHVIDIYMEEKHER